MAEKCIYSKWYNEEILDADENRPFMTVYNYAKMPDISTVAFYETAVELSENNCISVKIMERSDRMRANFYFRRLIIDENESLMWTAIHEMSDMYAYFTDKTRYNGFVASFVHIKKENLSKKP